ncbi:MAG: hypothetical protein ISR65_11160 [Bacteriovoracaceae bacterium]|nr:hypothetical protein [Bacteriovoracaceae bacterium]
MKTVSLLISIIFCTTSIASTLPDFRVTNMWMNQSCTGAYVTFTNKGAGLSADFYDRSIHPRTFFMVRSNKGERHFFLDQVDPNRRMTIQNGVATFNITDYLYLEKGKSVLAMVNYGYVIEESAYGNPNSKFLSMKCASLPTVQEKPLRVKAWGIVPDSDCSIKVILKNPGPKNLTLQAWRTSYSQNINNSLAFDGFAQSQKRMHQFDPQKKLRVRGGTASYTFRSSDFRDEFKPGDIKEVRLHGYWVRGNPTEVYDTKKVLRCGPDLTYAANYTVTPRRPRVGDTIKIKIKVKNYGSDTASASVAKLKFGGETFGKTYQVPALGPGRAFAIVRTIPINRAANYVVKLNIDTTNANHEYKENNNALRFTVRVRR